jgi:hypothetical protein
MNEEGMIVKERREGREMNEMRGRRIEGKRGRE